MKIIISPYSKKLLNGKPNPKNYPYWMVLVHLLKINGHTLIQIGQTGELKLVEDFRIGLKFKALADLIKECDCFISVDSFFPHFAVCSNFSGIVIFSRSNPDIFGHPQNINLLKDKKYLRPDQFGLWESCEYLEEAFVTPVQVLAAVQEFHLIKPLL